MIDTDKYTGHAQGEWTIEQNETGDECAINSQDYGTIAQTFYRDHDKLFMATTRLIADAPLLSAEVKRLREQNKLCFDTLMHWLLKVRDSHWDDKEHVLERIEEGYDLETMIHIYEARVNMTACSIEQDILDTLKEMVE